ncbi:hypothetical protein BDC45DRAFT_541970 [Circinella umbellata]|nr:hypothetical protein BDC45DRAFT_541970 [Circinella umbellata]
MSSRFHVGTRIILMVSSQYVWVVSFSLLFSFASPLYFGSQKKTLNMDVNSSSNSSRGTSTNNNSLSFVNDEREQNQQEQMQTSSGDSTTTATASQQQQALNSNDLYRLILTSLGINQVLLLDRLGQPETTDNRYNELYRLRLLNELMISQTQGLLHNHHNTTSYEHQELQYDIDQYYESQRTSQSLQNGSTHTFAHLSSSSSSVQNIRDSERSNQQQHPSIKCSKLIDPINYLSHDIWIHIFSFIKVKRKEEAFNLMRVSKSWMNKTSRLTAHVWEYGIRLKKEFVLFPCLGTHVKSLEFDQFSQQSDLFKMMETVKNYECTKLISICFNKCIIHDLQLFLKYLGPLTKAALILEFEYHQGITLPISLILKNCPNLEHLKYTTQNNDLQQNSDMFYSQVETIPRSNTVEKQQLSIYSLTDLTIGADFDNMDRITPVGSNINLKSCELIAIIKRALHLETLILCHVFNTAMDSSIIYAISELPSLQKLGLIFGLNDNKKTPTDNYQNVEQEHQQMSLHMALYALLAKHAALGTRNSLCDLTLNIVDDTILYQISRISSFVNLNLTDSLQKVSEQGILTFARELYSFGGAKNLVQLSLHQFDIQNYKVLCHFSRLKKLQVVDFSDCYLQKDGYKTLIDQSPSLKYVLQPLYDLHDVEVQEVTKIRTDDDNDLSKPTYIVPYKLIHYDEDIAITDYNMDNKRNKFIIMTEKLENDFKLLMSDQ